MVHTGVLLLVCVSLSIHRPPTTDDLQDISLFLDSLSSLLVVTYVSLQVYRTLCQRLTRPVLILLIL